MEPYESEKSCIIVLGMHRSGTSALTRVLNLLGVELGTNLLPSTIDNPKGFWEHREIFQIHERLLEDLGSFWDDIRPLPKNWWKGDAAIKAQKNILSVLKHDFKDSDLWGLKEPRMCRLMKFWHPIFDQLNFRPHFIIIFRNPLEVAASLKQRNGTPQNKSFMLWLQHVLASERDTRDFTRAFVSMKKLMDDWQPVMEKISRSLKITWPVDGDKKMSEIDDFLDRDLISHSIPDTVLEADPDIPKEISAIYRELKNAEQNGAQPHSEVFSNAAANIRSEMARFSMKALMEDCQSRLNQQDGLLEETRRLLGDTQKRLDEAESQLAEIRGSISWKITAFIKKGFGLLIRKAR